MTKISYRAALTPKSVTNLCAIKIDLYRGYLRYDLSDSSFYVYVTYTSDVHLTAICIISPFNFFAYKEFYVVPSQL